MAMAPLRDLHFAGQYFQIPSPTPELLSNFLTFADVHPNLAKSCGFNQCRFMMLLFFHFIVNFSLTMQK